MSELWIPAVADFERAAQLLPGEWQTRANLGMSLAQAGRKAEALAELDQALKMAPAAAQPRLAEARAAVAAGRLSPANPP